MDDQQRERYERAIVYLSGELADALAELSAQGAPDRVPLVTGLTDELRRVQDREQAWRSRSLELERELRTIADLANAGHAAGIQNGAVQWRAALQRIYMRIMSAPMPETESTREPGAAPVRIDVREAELRTREGWERP